MAWSVNDIKIKMLFLTRKNQSGAAIDDCINAWNVEQALLHTDLLGRWQRNNNGKAGINTGLIQNETTITALAPFIKPATISISSGQVNKPSLFAYTNALRINGKEVIPINHDQIASVNGSVIDTPSVANNKYYYTEYIGYYYLLPQSVTGTLSLDYIENCTDIVWNFSLDVNNRKVYNPSGSVQPQWLQNEIVLITKRALTNMGISFKDSDFTNAGRVAQNTGE